MRGALTHFQKSGGDYLTRKKLRAAHAKLIKSVITVAYLFSLAGQSAWRDGSALKSMHYFYRGTEFNS